MGNEASAPTGLSVEKAATARDTFRCRVAKAANVDVACASERGRCIIVKVSERAAVESAKQFGWHHAAPYDSRPEFGAHILIVTHALSWLHGTEITARLPHDSTDKTIDDMCLTLSQLTSLQEGEKGTNEPGPKFLFMESCESMGTWKWDAIESGDFGPLLLPDPFLHGGKWIPTYTKSPFSEEDNIKNRMIQDSECSPPHDSEYWPRHFVTISLLHPCEFAYATSMSVHTMVNLLGAHLGAGFYIIDKQRPCMVHNPKFISELKEIMSTIPASVVADGLSLDLRVRKGNTALDVVVSPRYLAHLLIPMEKAFDKHPVPKGTSVRGESEGGDSDIRFSSHHPDTGEPIQPGQGFWVINAAQFAIDPPNVVKLPTHLKKAFIEVPGQALGEERNLKRLMVITVYMPADVLAGMLHEAQVAVDADRARDWETTPLLMEWPDAFSGCQQARYPSKDDEANNNEPENSKDSLPLTFRFGAVGVQYFDGEYIINEDGTYVTAEDYKLPDDVPEVPSDLEDEVES